MNLLTNEETLITSKGNNIILTNRRIYMKQSQWGSAYSISIFLEDISSLETKYNSNIIFILLAVISVLAGVYLAKENGQALVAGLIFGALFLALWFYTRKHIISISSDGGASLNFKVEGMADDKIDAFIASVSDAKLKRTEELH